MTKHSSRFGALPFTSRIECNCKKQTENAMCVLVFHDSEVNMRQLAVSLIGVAASCLRFAVITALLAFMALPLTAQEQPIMGTPCDVPLPRTITSMF